ncbi:MAG: (2Fe-2S)-binding protein [Deltaproteobacteria bacterium]|nr:(2Fe-2S)-binding protein [Deltaproteobacteria bacterium]
MKKKLIELHVNGEIHSLAVKPNDTLLEALRDHLGLVGTKEGCSVGECGACTVLMNGRAVLSCLTLARDAVGTEITTIEGVSQGEALDPIQQAFVDYGAVQCGFCTPGMILTAKELLTRQKKPSVEQIKQAISGNFCRCTGYTKIVEAIEAASRMRGTRHKVQGTGQKA